MQKRFLKIASPSNSITISVSISIDPTLCRKISAKQIRDGLTSLICLLKFQYIINNIYSSYILPHFLLKVLLLYQKYVKNKKKLKINLEFFLL
jgi:hypothetical protein